MASPAPPPTARLRPSQAASSASSSSFPTSICGLGSLGDASRVSSVSFRRRPPASPLVRCSQDPGKIEVFNTEGTEQSQGGSTGSINHGKYSTRSFSSKEYSQLTVNPMTNNDTTVVRYLNFYGIAFRHICFMKCNVSLEILAGACTLHQIVLHE
jgi:hypothetical protein